MRIECATTTAEWGKDDLWFKVYTYADPARPDSFTVTNHYESSPLHMNAKGDSAFFVDISVPATGLHQIKFELMEKDSGGSKSLGSFDITRASARLGIEQSSPIHQQSSNHPGNYRVSWRVTSNIIPSLRVLALYCQRSSAGCDEDQIRKVAEVKETAYGAASDVIGLWKGPTAQVVSDAFFVASKVVDDIAELKIWLHELIEGDDDIYLQHVTQDQGDNAGGGFCPPNAAVMKMNNGDEINFATAYDRYFRFPLDTGPVTIQVREHDSTGRDVCLGALTIGEAEYNQLQEQGAKVVILTDFLNDRNNGEGAIYHLCYTVAREDWAKAPSLDANNEQYPYSRAIDLGGEHIITAPTSLARGLGDCLLFSSIAPTSSASAGPARYCSVINGIKGDWLPLGSEGDAIVGSPSAAREPSGRMNAVYLTQSGQFRHYRLVGDRWELVATFASAGDSSGPALVSMRDTRLDMFTRGPNGDMFHRIYDNGWKDAIYYRGGFLLGAPSAVARTPNTTNIVSRGRDNKVYYAWYDINIWEFHAWAPFDFERINISAPPAIMSRDPNSMEVFVRNEAGALLNKSWNSQTDWSPWTSTSSGLVFQGQPTAAAVANDDQHVFVHGMNGTPWWMKLWKA